MSHAHRPDRPSLRCPHHTRFVQATNRTDAAARALNAGVTWDLQCGTDPTKWGYNKLDAAFADGLVDDATLDAAVRQVLTLKFSHGRWQRAVAAVACVLPTPVPTPHHLPLCRLLPHEKARFKRGGAVPFNLRFVKPALSTTPSIDCARTTLVPSMHVFCAGLFDGRATVPAADITAVPGILDNATHRALARTAAQQSMVLLLNRRGPEPSDGRAAGRRGPSAALPWRTMPKKIALIGPPEASWNVVWWDCSRWIVEEECRTTQRTIWSFFVFWHSHGCDVGGRVP